LTIQLSAESRALSNESGHRGKRISKQILKVWLGLSLLFAVKCEGEEKIAEETSKQKESNPSCFEGSWPSHMKRFTVKKSASKSCSSDSTQECSWTAFG
jgi:hypothetical protein